MEAYLDPCSQAFAIASAAEPQPQDLGYEAAREALDDLQKHEAASDIAVETFDVQVHDFTTPMTIFRPKGTSGPCPVVFYTHGGGWVLGSPAAFAPLMEDLARQTGAAIVFPCYALAPEKQYPFQIRQTYSVLEEICRNGSKYGLLTDSIVLAGDSAGGHFAIAMTQLSREQELPARISGMILFNPVTDTHMKMKSYETYGAGYFLTSATLDWMIDAFLPNKKDRETALASPLSFLPDEALARFPPTMIILADADPLVDEGRAFGDRLQKAGADAAVIRAAGTLHAFFLLKPLRESATARAIIETVAGRIRKHLG